MFQPRKTQASPALGSGGIAKSVEPGGVRLLFDCGRGATLRLAQAGVPVGSVSRLFLTHCTLTTLSRSPTCS
jgi:ribonuclease BN (tRNA processing enzyme)